MNIMKVLLHASESGPECSVSGAVGRGVRQTYVCMAVICHKANKCALHASNRT